MHFDCTDQAEKEYMTVQSRIVHTITDRFSMANAYLINEEQLVIVDPGTELNVKQIQNYLWTFLHRPLSHIDLIVLTHFHPYHAAGLEALLKICDAPVAALAIIQEHTKNAQFAQTEHKHKNASPSRFTKRSGAHQHFYPSLSAYEQQMKLINLWLHDVEGLPGHPSWRVIASPNLIPQSLYLYNPFSKELLCGDAIITIQWGAPLLRGGPDCRLQEEMLHTLRSLPIHYLYPGHGRPILGLQPLRNAHIEW